MSENARFRALVEAHQRRAFRAALRVLGDQDEALDATQDAFLALHLHRGSVGEKTVASWVERVATNSAIDRLRRRGRRRGELRAALAAEERSGADTDPSALAADHEERALLRSALRRLPDRQREVVTLRVVQHRSFAEIRDALGISDGAAKVHFRRGIERLAATLRSETRTEPDS